MRGRPSGKAGRWRQASVELPGAVGTVADDDHAGVAAIKARQARKIRARMSHH
jgi:hypothetical protein